MAVFSHVIARGIHARPRGVGRKLLLGAGVGLNLGVLGLFKYLGFFLRTLGSLIPAERLPLANLILPVGISFVTFEVLSYLIDVYRGDSPADSWLDFVLLVMFFPHLMAGPILKPREFIPQLVSGIDVTFSNIEAALPQFLLGLVKKALVADTLAMFVNPVFASPMRFSTLTAWLAVLAYALQIYCDFSGYSDMAIASARCFGLSIPANFDMPYISRSISEFWRRWHISLMRWFREYVYFPLGGSREGQAKTYRNLLIVMLLSGLWHGAGWTFVIWGGLHGLAMCVQRAWSRLASRWQSEKPGVGKGYVRVGAHDAVRVSGLGGVPLAHDW
jgi:alginate O-acetyltransferase complex protein AlgI